MRNSNIGANREAGGGRQLAYGLTARQADRHSSESQGPAPFPTTCPAHAPHGLVMRESQIDM